MEAWIEINDRPRQFHKIGVFNGEVAIHSPGLAGLDKPIVWVFPERQICLDCGWTTFKVPEEQLRALQQEASSPRAKEHASGEP